MILTRLIGTGKYRTGFLIATPRQPWVVWDGSASRALPVRFKIVQGELRDFRGISPASLVPSFVPIEVTGKRPAITPRKLGYDIQIIVRGRTVAKDYWEVPFDPTDAGVNWYTLFTNKERPEYPDPIYQEDPRLSFPTIASMQASFANYEQGHLVYVEENTGSFWGAGETQWVNLDVSDIQSAFVLVTLPGLQVTSSIEAELPEGRILDIAATMGQLTAASEVVFVAQGAYSLDISAGLPQLQASSDATANAPGTFVINIATSVPQLAVTSSIEVIAPSVVELDVSFQTGILQVSASGSFGVGQEVSASGTIYLPSTHTAATSSYDPNPPALDTEVTGEPEVPTVVGTIGGTAEDPVAGGTAASGTIYLPSTHTAATSSYSADSLSLDITLAVPALTATSSIEVVAPAGVNTEGTIYLPTGSTSATSYYDSSGVVLDITLVTPALTALADAEVVIPPTTSASGEITIPLTSVSSTATFVA